MPLQRTILCTLLGCSFAISGFFSQGWAQALTEALPMQPSRIWAEELGQGFNRGTLETGVAAGAGVGHAICGSSVAHDLALASVNTGWMLSNVVAPNSWYRGNWEFLAELFGGAQFRPEGRYVAGLTPLLRYNFATGTRWVPFVTAGAGVAFTDIGRPDLSGTFQFDPQAGMGTHFFFRQHAALTLEYRWLHLSNAGLQHPNHGVNTQLFRAGVTWFF